MLLSRFILALNDSSDLSDSIEPARDVSSMPRTSVSYFSLVSIQNTKQIIKSVKALKTVEIMPTRKDQSFNAAFAATAEANSKIPVKIRTINNPKCKMVVKILNSICWSGWDSPNFY